MRIRIALALAALAAAPGVRAEERVAPDSKERNIEAYVELLRSDIRAQAKDILTTLMDLDEKQSAAFWPIEREWETDLAKVGDERLALVKDYGERYQSMTDSKADDIAKRSLALEAQRTALKRKYYDRLKKALSPVLAVRFFQIENQIQLLIDLQIAANLPIIEEGPKR